MNTRHSSKRGSAVSPPPLAWVSTLMGWMGEAFRLAERSIGPVVDILIRLRLAQIFFVSGVLKAADFEHAIYLSTHEYPVSWMDPVTAAYLGVAIKLGGSVLLAVGLAAVAMLALSWVIQFNYVALDTNLFWAALFGWYVARGAGSLSLDHALSRGLADSALPLAKTVIGFSDGVTRYFGPVYQGLLRLWIGAALALAVLSHGGTVSAELSQELSLWLPLKAAWVFPSGVALVCAVLLAVGLATRFAGLCLILAILGKQMADPALADDWYWLAVAGLLVLFGPGELSIDALIDRGLRRVFPQLEGKPAFSLEGLPRVVIVGAGFGGLACAAALRRARVSVTLVDRHNYRSIK
jgi:putative oxidoreductase